MSTSVPRLGDIVLLAQGQDEESPDWCPAIVVGVTDHMVVNLFVFSLGPKRPGAAAWEVAHGPAPGHWQWRYEVGPAAGWSG